MKRRGFLTRLGDRWSAWRAGRFAASMAVQAPPAPFGDGDPDRAAALAAGDLRFGPDRLAIAERSPFALTPPGRAWRDGLHAMAWLEDALVAAREDRAVLRGWAEDWLARGGLSASPANPALAAARLRALLGAWPLLTRGAAPRRKAAWARTLGAHAAHLERRAAAPADALSRLEIAATLTVALSACAAEGAPGPRLRRALRQLGRAAEGAVDGDGGVASRNPADLARATAWLGWAGEALRARGCEPPAGLVHALGRAAPALRALRLGDGALTRLHGAGAPPADDLADAALARAAALAPAAARGRRREGAMGVARLSAGRAVLLVDAAAPPDTPHACASALSMAFGVGRTRLFGAIGDAWAMPADWRLGARATAAFSAVEVAGASAARLERLRADGGPRRFAVVPALTPVERAEDAQGQWLRCAHDGYARRFGLTVARRVLLGFDGRSLRCEDTLSCADAPARRRFDRAASDRRIAFCVRLHLGPTVDAEPAGENRARLTLPDGAVWEARAAIGTLSLAESVSLDGPDGAPRPATQIAIMGAARDYWGRAVWSLTEVRPPDGRERRRRG